MLQNQKGRSQPPVQRRSQAPRNEQQLANFDDFQTQQMRVFQEFNEMSNRMFQGFDSHFGSIMPRFGGFNRIDDDLMGFHDISEQMRNIRNQPNGPNGQFQMVTKSYVQSSKMGPDGQMVTEKYFDNNHVGVGRDGKTITDRKQGYKHTGTGVDKFAHERMMDDQGKKYIKERDRSGQIQTTNHYYNLEEDQKDQFDQRWKGYAQQIGFGDLKNKQLAYQKQTTIPNQGALGYYPEQQSQMNENRSRGSINSQQSLQQQSIRQGPTQQYQPSAYTRSQQPGNYQSKYR